MTRFDGIEDEHRNTVGSAVGFLARALRRTASGNRPYSCSSLRWLWSLAVAVMVAAAPLQSRALLTPELLKDIDTGAGSSSPDGFAISGRVTELPLCQGAMRGVTVRIDPLGWTAETDLSDGSFRFDGVPPGDYTLTVTRLCNPFGCWAPVSVEVTDADVDVTICPDDVTPTETPTATPSDDPEATLTPTLSPTETNVPVPVDTETSTPTPTGSCCGEACSGLSFIECEAAAETGDCDGWGDPCELPLECGETSGSVSFGDFEVEPAQPKVGDAVTLRFEVMPRVYSVENVELQGASPFLEVGNRSGTTFQATAVQAGRVSVSLEVAYRNEEACTDGSGNTYYSPGPRRTATSPSHEFEILDAPTPTATSTETPTPAPTKDGNGGGGCQINPGHSRGDLGAPFWLLSLVFILRRLTGRS